MDLETPELFSGVEAVPAIEAMRHLSALLPSRGVSESEWTTARWLHLLVKMRAAADSLAAFESSEPRQSAVMLGCQAYLEIVMCTTDEHCIGSSSDLSEAAATRLGRAQWRSERYLQVAEDSILQVVRLGSRLLRKMIRGCACESGGTYASGGA